jgi:hypothetical protein
LLQRSDVLLATETQIDDRASEAKLRREQVDGWEDAAAGQEDGNLEGARHFDTAQSDEDEENRKTKLSPKIKII